MGIITNIERLNPLLANRAERFLEYCGEHHIKVMIIETLRRLEVQEAYYAQGRKSLEDVNALRRKAGLDAISKDENSITITRSMKSRHLEGFAVDICLVHNGMLWWDAPKDIWEEFGILAETFGLSWCPGDYSRQWGNGWNNPHFELMDNFPC